MKILMAQLNPTIGDFDGNLTTHKSVMEQYGTDHDLLVFGELSLCGYYPKDMLGMKGFIEAHETQLSALIEFSKSITAAIAVGCVLRNTTGKGKPFYNAACVIEQGHIIATYKKQLLPDYNIFDENRWFEPGTQTTTFHFRGKRIGLLICEDIWLDHNNPLYQIDPVNNLAAETIDLAITLHGSPGSARKPAERLEVIQSAAQKLNATLVYVNQVGGQDDIVFDGGSIAVSAAGEVLAQQPYYQESCITLDTNNCKVQEANIPTPMTVIADQVCMGLKDYMRRCGFKKVIVGSSGGIDSALTIALAARAIGAENVIAVTMPSQFSSEGSVSDSQKLCDNLGIPLLHAPIGNEFELACENFEKAHGHPMSNLAKENEQARIRGKQLMALSNTNGAMLLTTGNKSEAAVGYFTLYGDSCGGLNLLGDLYKHYEVYPLSRWINEEAGREIIPEAVINKAPSAELSEGQQDTDSLPDYPVLDPILKLYIEYHALPESVREKLEQQVNSFAPEVVNKVIRLVNNSEYKRSQVARIIRVQRICFGSGRQVPIAGQYDWSKDTLFKQG